jgi:hypothetical protein
LSLAPAALAKNINTTEELIRRYKTNTQSPGINCDLCQKTTNIDKDGNKKVEIWYEALSVPGSLRIDFTPVKDGNGILFTNNQIYVFKDGKVENNRPYVHPLMILGFDMYRLPQADILEKLKGLSST